MSANVSYNDSKTERIEEGIVILYNGPNPALKNHAWGVEYEDGQSTSMGWVPVTDVDKVVISNAEFVKVPSDVTYKGSHYVTELNRNGKITKVRRTTTVEIA